ncbi:MYND-type domain-containing protein [Mycena venus]|uniref:MYND-type domain-containing protein n=1 Tax=Mycena venus TaxID=2733690 RepID=A0A8H6XLF0_9AGAR|nr:MYND-type domain-containing protein [Mycena venus]
MCYKGDTHVPFSKLGRQLKLPQTAVLAVRAPDQVPFLYEESFAWFPSFDELGELIERPNPTPALLLMERIFRHLSDDCAWPANRIHIFGFAQGGSVAVEFGIKMHRETLGSIVTISGPLLSYPTLATLSLTPVLVAYLEHKMGAEGGMPASKPEWEPIMRFWSEVLARRRVEATVIGHETHNQCSRKRVFSPATRVNPLPLSPNSTTNMDSHDADCSCEDPNARLTSTTLDTLVQLKTDLKPLDMTPDEITEKADFLLQYLKASDIPPRSKGCCTHVLSQFHAHFALCSLANISYLVRPEPGSPFETRLLEAWPDIWKWLDYTFENWVISPLFRERDNANRYHAFQTIIVSLRSFIKIPAICERILAADGGKKTFVMLGSCWLYEIEDEFKAAAKNDLFLTATEPLLDLGTFKPGAPPDAFFGCIMPSTQDAGKPARVALDHLDWYLTNPGPWSPPAIFILDYHLRMATKMAIALPYLYALLALHSVRTITRILYSLTAGPYDETTAPGVALAISSALEYLETNLPRADGFAWTTHAVQIGLLPALLRTQTWLGDMPDDDAQSTLVKLIRLLSLYSMYPSLLRYLVRSIRRVRELGLHDAVKDNPPVWTAWLELEALVADRSRLFDTDMEIRCHNPSCRKIDTQNNFSSCSSCFTTAYCTSECQKEHWKSGHKVDCKTLKELRMEGKAPPVSPEDYDFATKLVIEEIGRRKEEIVRVWREEMPARTPVVSLNYFLDDPKGVLVVGSPSKHPPQGYTEFRQVREMWEDVISQDIHREHIIVGAYLPHGSTGKLHFLWLGVDDRLGNEDSLSVVEKLIKTVEMM